ncbi:MAG: 3'(2'),5'-bisphosphate nucleotidase CysQ [Actinomycetales bacterium]|nr:3'(2'),5'-bisphosphate nucleotidase CysQ [Actinomycetales bacterium]
MTAASGSDADLAADLAQQAGRLLCEHRQRSLEGPTISVTELRDQADALAHRMLVAAFAHARSEDAVLSEEGADDPRRLGADRVWIIDPLDGTYEYGQYRPDFAVHIALWDRFADQPDRLALGIVDLPAIGLTLRSDAPPLAPAMAPADRPVRLVVSRTRPPAQMDRLLAALSEAAGRPAEQVDIGSVGAKVAEILSGRADAYVHTTGFHEWDIAAPAAVARAAGLHVSDIAGAPLALNQPVTRVSSALVCRTGLAPALLAVLAHP